MSDRHATVSYSQFGEDVLVTHLLPQPTGFYVDVGAHDPWRYSNTALLHLRGWHGINIDADARATARFGTARPGDVNLLLGVADEPGLLSFARFEDGAVGSFDDDMVRRQTPAFGTPVMQEIPVQTLATILDRFKPRDLPIDYLNIDCEGFDLRVLQGNDWSKYRPKLITVEIGDLALDDAASHPIHQLLRANGYMFRAHYFATSFFHHLSAL